LVISTIAALMSSRSCSSRSSLFEQVVGADRLHIHVRERVRHDLPALAPDRNLARIFWQVVQGLAHDGGDGELDHRRRLRIRNLDDSCRAHRLGSELSIALAFIVATPWLRYRFHLSSDLGQRQLSDANP
jgi:hypothetical protein